MDKEQSTIDNKDIIFYAVREGEGLNIKMINAKPQEIGMIVNLILNRLFDEMEEAREQEGVGATARFLLFASIINSIADYGTNRSKAINKGGNNETV